MLADTDFFNLDQPESSGTLLASRLDIALSKHKTNVSVAALFLGHDGARRLCRMTMVRLPRSGNPMVQLVVGDISDQPRVEASLPPLAVAGANSALYRTGTEGRKPIASAV